MSARFVVLGLARPRAGWFSEVGRWATSGSAPLEFIRCVAREELAANLTSGRPFSALLVDGGSHGLDRDLVELARLAGTATIVVDDATVGRDWRAIGVHSVLPADFSRTDLVAALEGHATPLERTRTSLAELLDGSGATEEPGADGAHRRWISVIGAGSGTSVVAMALAQALGDRHPAGGAVVLADLALDADQAMLHAAPDIVPGVSELVEAFRAGRVTADAVRELTFAVDGRGYQLLLGLRRHRDWAALRPRATAAALQGLADAFEVVVADVDPDLEGEAECGSIEIEERNALARAAVQRADAVVAVGTADLKGVHSLIRSIGRLRRFGVDDARILPVVNRAPRHPRARAELTKAIAELAFDAFDVLDGADGSARPGAGSAGAGQNPALAGALYLPNVRRLDSMLRDGARLPDQLGRPVATAVEAVLARAGRSARPSVVGQPVRTGALGGLLRDRAAS